MEKRNFIIPEFGPLAGLRVIGAGSLIAMPFAATMMADFGAEVIQIERPKIGDTYRSFPPLKKTEQGTAGSSWMQDARNRLSMTLELDLNDPDVKEIFFRLIERSDIFIENMVWLDKLGIHDSELLKINHRLVIVHVSGYGHKEFGGLPEICDQASYDMTSQAYSGYALFNGYPDRDPLIVKPSLGDYITALFALFGMLSAHISAKTRDADRWSMFRSLKLRRALCAMLLPCRRSALPRCSAAERKRSAFSRGICSPAVTAFMSASARLAKACLSAL